ncbi:hypothetical protein HON59_02805 [bacterium]|jgi:hypothetical protein|nr:hypothetical protein [bacterium]MBT4894961.1 hypothetical protein [bacterium]
MFYFLIFLGGREMKKKCFYTPIIFILILFFLSFNSVKAGKHLDLGLSEKMIREHLIKKDHEQDLVPIGVLRVPGCGGMIMYIPFVTFEKSKEYKKIRNMQPRDLDQNDVKARVTLKNGKLERFEVKMNNGVWISVYPKPKKREREQTPLPQHLS